MNSNLKIILIFTAILAIILVVMCYPVFVASYDDVKYVDGKVYKPVDGKYDFETFSLNCSNTTCYKAKVENSGFIHLLDNCGNHTINVFEWDKMNYLYRFMLNSSISKEFRNPSHMKDGIRIIDVDLDEGRNYAASSYDPSTNTLVYLSSPSEAETLEMIKSLEFNG